MSTQGGERARTPEVTEGQIHLRLKWMAFGMAVINHGLLVSTIWGKWLHVAVVTAVFALVAVLNHILAQQFFSVRTRLAEAARLAFNILAIILYGRWTEWALPVWLYLPFNSLWVDSRVDPLARRRFFVLLALTCGIALADGAPLFLVACFVLLSSITYVISEGRVMLTWNLAQQHEELGRAHEELARAHAQLAVAHQVALEQERLSSLGMLAAGMAHEINNPMSYVKSNVHSLLLDLKAEKELSPAMREYVDDVLPATLDGIKRVCAIVGDLRRFARGDPEAMVEYDLNVEVEAALRISHSRLRPRCEVVLELGALPKLMGRPGQIAQVLVNLLVNAAQAMPEGGTVVVSTWMEGAQAVLKVRDTGMGMPPEVLGRLFQPFFTTKPLGEGTGLGLAVVHGIVTAHKGRIDVESQAGRGSTFTVRLPRVPPLDLAQAPSATPPAPGVERVA